MHEHPGTALDNVRFTAHIDDCNAVEQRARTAAFAEAKRRAEAIAALNGVLIGEPTTINENGGCLSYGGPGPGVPLDVSTMTASVQIYENVTYAIVSNGAKRRPL